MPHVEPAAVAAVAAPANVGALTQSPYASAQAQEVESAAHSCIDDELSSVTATSVAGQLNCSITDAGGTVIAQQSNNTMIANCTK